MTNTSESEGLLPSWQTVVAFYNNLILHVVPGPRSLSYSFPFLLLVAALLSPPRTLSHRQLRWLVLPIYYAIQAHVWVHHQSFDVISMNAALTAFMVLGWYDVRQDFRRVKRLAPQDIRKSAHKLKRQVFVEEGEVADGASGRGKVLEPDLTPAYVLEPYPESFLPRILWVSILLSSIRLTDWHIGSPNHDSQQPSPLKSFTRFSIETATQGLFAYVLLDFTSPYMVSKACNGTTLAVGGVSMLNQVLRSLVLLAHLYAALALFTALLPHLISICALFLLPSLRSEALLSPLTWPGHFGPLSSIYSASLACPRQKTGLRAFWGVFWHQNMRYITSTPGLALAALLGLRRGSGARYMIIVASSFFWSGVVHMGVVPPEPRNTSIGMWEMRFRVASFFWLQIVGVAVEELASSFFAAVSSNRRCGQGGQAKQATARDEERTVGDAQSKAIQFVVAATVLIWTVSFLALSARWTLFPVGCELGWLRVRLPAFPHLGHQIYRYF